MENTNEYDNMIERLEALLEDSESSWAADICADAINLLERTRDQRVGWRCYAGGETFVTHDESVANDWMKDDLDVEKFFI